MNQLHLRHYIYIFVALSAFLFIIFGASVHRSLHKLDSEIYQSSINAAQLEFKQSIDVIKQRVDTVAADIAGWDEIYQQLHNPNYYDYWKENRLHGANLPQFIESIEIYNSQRIALSDLQDRVLPREFEDVDRYFQYLNRHVYYVRLYPIMARNNKSQIAGYIGIYVDLLKALPRLGQFTFVDHTSLTTPPDLPNWVFTEGLGDYIQFQPRSNPSFNNMRELVYSTLEFGAFMVIAFLIALYAMIKLIITNPVLELSNYVDKLKLGKPDRIPLRRLPIFELDNLRHSLEVYQNELETAYRSLDIKNDELWKLAHHDPLTGIANRRAFDKDWKSHLAIAADKRISISLMLIDCDHFKAINDTYGHDVGDNLIRSLSRLLQDSIREGDRLYRIGGDEFVTVLWDTSEKSAEQIAERCLKNIRNQRFADLGIKEPISISIGISHKNASTDNHMEALPRQADIAMYHAKKAGSRKIVHYEASLEKKIAPLVSNRILDAVIKAAETGRGITMHYQPIVNSETTGIDYFEALIRIEDQHGLLSPGDIFPVVERLSLEAELDIAIINRVTEDMKSGRFPEHTGVSINLSSMALTLPDLADHLCDLEKFNDRYYCVLEVTETTLISNINSASLKLSDLRSRGFKIALDDFGSGYSSIRYLASMPIDIVKFDISMIRQLAEEGPESVISGTAQVILNSGYRLVAEGIETDQVRDMVISMGASHLQGYLISPPLPVDQLDSFRYEYKQAE
jgi:diguanylate cyclase (GGDEF)-like protein